jgi:hypothetical protein
VKEFEMRKNAKQYARQTESKSGELDMRRLDRYKFTNDLFRKFTEVPKGKNHGMVMFVDMSISMSPVYQNTMEQALILALFCKKVGIPFQVYGFSDSFKTHYPNNVNYTESKFTSKSVSAFLPLGTTFHLKTLINSDLNARDFKRAASMLLIIGTTVDGFITDKKLKSIFGGFNGGNNIGNIELNGTPFIETLIASKQIINDFKAQKKVDITNVIYLTDGEGVQNILYPEMYRQYNDTYSNYDLKTTHNIGFVDSETKKRVVVEANENVQTALTRLIRDITECRHIGFYVADMNVILRKSDECVFDSKDLKKSVKDHGFFKYPNIGYDSYYYVVMKNESIKLVNFNTNKVIKTTEEIGDAFIAHQNKKKIDRVLVTNFATEISSNTML